MWLASIILIVIVLLLHLFFPKKYNSLSFEWKISKIWGPTRVPYFGNLFMFNVKPEQLINLSTQLYNQWKPLYRTDILGHVHVVLTNLDDLKIIFNSTDHITKSDEYEALLPWLGTGLLISTGEKWHNHRKWLTPVFHYQNLNRYIDTINKNSNILVEQLKTMVKNDHVNINQLVTLCTFDIICETAMGIKVEAQKSGEKEHVKATLRMSHLCRTVMFSPWLQTFWFAKLFPTGREFFKVLKKLHGFTEKVINERKALLQKKLGQTQGNDNLQLGKKAQKSFLDLLIEMSEDQTKMTREDIRQEVDTFMFEGHDTTSAAICWAIYLLGHHPEIQEKAHRELQEIFGDSNRDPTYADLSEMKYLERIIKETLRLYPSVPFLGRKLSSDVKIREYVLPAGVNIGVLVYCIHRDERYYPDPLKFDPDRFLTEAMQSRHPFSYIPFSAGPRNCIGQRFAMMELKIVLSQILRKFQMTSLDAPENVKILMDLILRPKDGLRIAFKPR